MYAAMSNPNPAVITTLVAAGASVDVLTPAKMTPLMLAAKSTKKPAVVQALLEAGANMKLKDSSGKTAFDYATGNAALMFTAQLVALGVGRL
jgi:ankyrin repeat protein